MRWWLLFAYLKLPFLVFSAVFSLLFSLLFVFSWSGRELIFIRARVAVTSSSQTTLPGRNRNTKPKCSWCHRAVTSLLPCWKEINDQKVRNDRKAIRSLAVKVIFFNTRDKLEDTQFSAYYKTPELFKTPKITEMHNHRFERLPENSKSGHWIGVSGSMCSHTNVIKGAAGSRNEAWIFFPFGNLTEPWTLLQNSVNLFWKAGK